MRSPNARSMPPPSNSSNSRSHHRVTVTSSSLLTTLPATSLPSLCLMSPPNMSSTSSKPTSSTFTACRNYLYVKTPKGWTPSHSIPFSRTMASRNRPRPHTSQNRTASSNVKWTPSQTPFANNYTTPRRRTGRLIFPRSPWP